MTATSALWPRQVALVAAVRGDATLQTALGGVPGATKVYSGLAPEGTALPFIVMGVASEAGRAAFGSRAVRAGEETLDVYGRTKAEALAIYTHLVRILDGTALVLTGHQPTRGSVRLAFDTLDAPHPVTGERAYHAVVRYAATTQATP